MITAATSIDLGPNFGPLVVVAGWIFFALTYTFFGMIAPKMCRKTEFLTWRWKSVSNSLLHSIISGVGALISYYVTPELIEDVVDYFTHSTHLLLSFSLGYFTFDFVDLLIHNPRDYKTCELMVHHISVSSGLFIAVIFRRYIGYANAALLVELSDVCLHVRQLFYVVGMGKSDKIFRVNSLLNVVTFSIFRILPLIFMTLCGIIIRNRVPVLHYTVGASTLVVIILISVFISYRVFKSDFFPGKNNS